MLDLDKLHRLHVIRKANQRVQLKRKAQQRAALERKLEAIALRKAILGD